MHRIILIVEDNPEERKIFSTYFQFIGGTVLEAANGKECLREARDHHPNLILMDLSMPVMNGWETLLQLREDPVTESIPVIAVTAHHLPQEDLEKAGFCGYLEKPIAPYRILEEVERCVGRLDSGLSNEHP